MKLKKRNKHNAMSTLYREGGGIDVPGATWNPGMGDHKYPWEL